MTTDWVPALAREELRSFILLVNAGAADTIRRSMGRDEIFETEEAFRTFCSRELMVSLFLLREIRLQARSALISMPKAPKKGKRR